MKNVSESIKAVVVAVGTVVVFAVLGAYLTKWVINYLLTQQVLLALFGASQITFWKAFWLNFLCGWLFKPLPSTDKK